MQPLVASLQGELAEVYFGFKKVEEIINNFEEIINNFEEIINNFEETAKNLVNYFKLYMLKL